MKIIDYDNIVLRHSSVTDIESMALKQLAKGKFVNDEDNIETVVEKDGDRLKVIFHDTDVISCYDFRLRVYSAHPKEPCTEYLYNKTESYKGKSLIEMLSEYKVANIKKGKDLSNEVWFKLYSKHKLEHEMRDLYHATWIDYEAQLIHSNVIFDENYLYGIWAMPFSSLLDCLNEECMELYGRSLFIVKPVSDVDYLLDGKEVIGDKFSVISKLETSKIEDIKKLLEIQSNIYDKKLSSQYEKLLNEKSNNNDLRNQLNSMKNLISQLRCRMILCICLSIVIGVCLGLFLFKNV